LRIKEQETHLTHQEHDDDDDDDDILNEYHTEFTMFDHIKSLGSISVSTVGRCFWFVKS